jgi:hypothetical protein
MRAKSYRGSMQTRQQYGDDRGWLVLILSPPTSKHYEYLIGLEGVAAVG